MPNVLGIDLGSFSMAFAILEDGKYIKSWAVRVGYTQEELRKTPELEQLNLYKTAHDVTLEAIRIWENSCLSDVDSLIAFEDIPMRFPASRKLIEVGAIIKTICSQRDILYDEISPTTVKKTMTGSGKSPKDHKEKKQLMVNAVNEGFGLKIEDHNIADAVAIGMTAYLLEKE